ncbi:MAG: hypothetical protein AB7O88_05160 [Reyranellaceae bacterium]
MPETTPASSIRQAITRELCGLLKRHGCSHETATQLAALPPMDFATRACEVLEILGARPHLLAVVASYGTTLDDESVLELLRFARPAGPTVRRGVGHAGLAAECT